MKKWFLILILLFLLIGITCKKDFEYPDIQTKEVTNIDSAGAVFNAEILNLGNNSIIDHGFVWNSTGNPTFEKSYPVSLGETENIGEYSAKIKSDFEEGKRYFVRAFVNTGESIFYGQEERFISLGCLGPKIISFSPDSTSWGDTIIITGENFSLAYHQNVIKFGEITTIPISSSNSEIVALVPFDLDRSDVYISVSVFGNISTGSEKFRLKAPVIDDFNPKSGIYPDIVEISGSYFHPNYTKVKFDSSEANIHSVEFNKILAEVPLNLRSGEVDLSVTVCSKQVISDTKFYNLAPEILSFSPVTGTFGEEITILGERFSPDISANIVRFGNVLAEVTEASENSLKILVPSDLSVEYSIISVSTGQTVSYSDDEFKLKGPVIDNFSPAYGSRGDIINISGHNFNPVSELNKVYIGYKLAEVESSDSNNLSIIIPDDILHGDQELRIVLAEMEFIAAAPFTCHEPWTRLEDFGGIKRNSAYGFSISGKGYFVGGKDSYNAREFNDLWMYDPSDNTWTEKASIPIDVWGGESFATTDFAYILFYEQLWRYDPNNDEWTRVSDFPGSAESQRTAFSIGDKGYVGTGYTGINPTDEFWEYDESTDSWTQKADYAGGNSRSTASFSINGKGYICLGIENCTKLWEYDPTLDNWTEKLTLTGIVQGLPNKRPYSVGLSCNGKGYIVTGGCSYGCDDQYKDIYQYDPISNTCVRLVDMPASAYKRQSASGFTIGNKMYIGTGVASSHISLKDFWEFDPSKLKPE